MNMTEAREKAIKLGIKPGKMKKVDLVRAIQNKEGYSSCYQTGLDSCDQYECCWRSDCLPSKNTKKTAKSKRDEYLKKIKADLEEFKTKIDDVKEQAKTLAGKSKAGMLEEIKKIEKKSEEEIRQKLHTLAEASEDVWKKTKKGIDSSWDEVSKTVKGLMAKFGSTKK